MANLTDELEWCTIQWEDLKGREDISTDELRERKVYGSARGVWRDAGRTRQLGAADGYTVSVLHLGRKYADDLYDDGVIYHFPSTKQPTTDNREIASLKNTEVASLPVFVISRGNRSDTRKVQLGFVSESQNDRCLILFSDTPLASALPKAEETNEPFEILKSGTRKTRTQTATTRSASFKYGVETRCGRECALCDIKHPDLLEAAHVIPVSDGGPDDPRNGLVLCATHHREFDAFLFSIEPRTHEILTSNNISLRELGITKARIKESIAPANEALKYRFDKFQP